MVTKQVALMLLVGSCNLQVSRKVAFGATIEPVSQYNGKQYETYMSIRKVMQIYIPSEMLP